MNREVENFLSSYPYRPRTKESYRPILNELVALSGLDRLDVAGLIDFVTRPEWGNSSQLLALFCCKKYLRWKYGESHPALPARIKRTKPKPRRSLSPDKALEVLASFNPHSMSGARDLAIIAFGLDTRFRRQELCDMQLGDVDFYANRAMVICKGGQWGVGVFSLETAVILQQWLAWRKPADGVGNLFVSLKTGRGLTSSGMGCVFKRLTKKLGFQISAHDLCSSFATLTTLYGAPSRTVQQAGRWAHIEMVEHYTGNLRAEAIRPHLPMANLGKR